MDEETALKCVILSCLGFVIHVDIGRPVVHVDLADLTRPTAD